MKEPLELWRLNFRTFLVMKDTSTNTRTLRMTLSDLPSTEIGAYKHCTTSTVREIGI